MSSSTATCRSSKHAESISSSTSSPSSTSKAVTEHARTMRRRGSGRVEYQGFWWLSEKPEEKIAGILKFDPAKGATLGL